jgi:transposase
MNGFPEHIVGIDVSKEKLDLHFLHTGQYRQFVNSPAGIKKLIKQLPPPGDVFITLEATGGYEARLVA